MIPDDLHLLVLTTSFPNRSNPAGGVFVRRLVESLPENFHVTVVTPGTPFHDNEIQAIGIHTKPFRYAPRKYQTLAHQPGGLPMVLRKRKADLVFLPCLCLSAFIATFRRARKADLIHGHWVVSGLIAGLAGLLMRRPAVTTLRGTDYTWAHKFCFGRLLLWCCLGLNRRVVTVSREMARQLSAWFPDQRRKILFIPNGVDVSFRKGLEHATGRYSLVVIGNLIPGKRVDVVIRAFAQLGQSTTSTTRARMIIVGQGPERNNLSALVQGLGVDQQVHFIGIQQPDRIADILRSCDAMVLASESEGRPNVVLEAMAAGVPVIASDIDGVREIIQHEHNGLLFPVGDVDRLAAWLVRLRNDRELGHRLAANARQWIDGQELSWSQTARKYADVYHQVLQEFQQGRTVCVE